MGSIAASDMDIITLLQSVVHVLVVVELRANHPHRAKFYRLYMAVRWCGVWSYGDMELSMTKLLIKTTQTQWLDSC